MDRGFDLLYELKIYKDNTAPDGRYGYWLNTTKFGSAVNILDSDLDDIPDRLRKHLVKANVLKETENDGLSKVQIRITINKTFEYAIEGFMAYYRFKKFDKENDNDSCEYRWTRVGKDIDEVRQLLVEQLGAIIQGESHPIVTFIGLAISALSALPNSDEIENDYLNTISDGLGVASLRISITKNSDDL